MFCIFMFEVDCENLCFLMAEVLLNFFLRINYFF